ncbi:MAG: DUF4249 domain-containing protein [Cyclobacteriaceae bacterium]
MKYIILILILFILSCEQNVDPELPVFEQRAVVTSIIHPDSAITVFLTENISVLSTKRPGSVTGSRIDLYENDLFLGSLEETTINPSEYESQYIDTLRGVYKMDYYPKAGSTYRMEADNEKYPDITAITEIPEQTSDFEVVISDPQIIQIFDESESYESVIAEYVANITIKDSPGINYYAVSLLFKSTDIDQYFNSAGEEICELSSRIFEQDFTSNSIIFELGESSGFENEAGEVFNDDLFENQNFEFQITFRVWGSRSLACGEMIYSDTFMIQLRSLSEEYYQYMATTTLQKAVLEDPFAEPVQIYSNIEGGLGVFGGYNFETFEFSMRELLDDLD